MLQSILTVTHAVPDLAAIEAAYCSHLGYRVVARDTVGADLAAVWSARQCFGRGRLLLQPESGAPVYLQFVEQPAQPDQGAYRTAGWQATELHAQHVDSLAERLADGPFEIIGEPRPLNISKEIRAMQIRGPAGEILYCTQITDSKHVETLGTAQSPVDRVFITVAGGSDLKAMQRFYAERLDLLPTEGKAVPVKVVNRVLGRDDEMLTTICTAALGQGYTLELDELPQDTPRRLAIPGLLPPGMASVAYLVDSYAVPMGPFLAGPQAVQQAPYNGRRVALSQGAAGEFLELIEHQH